MRNTTELKDMINTIFANLNKTCEETKEVLNKLEQYIKEDIKINYDVGDILHTTNGDFLIISIQSDIDNKNKYGAIYLDDDNDYPIELQYINSNIKNLVEDIRKDGNIIKVTKFRYIKN